MYFLGSLVLLEGTFCLGIVRHTSRIDPDTLLIETNEIYQMDPFQFPDSFCIGQSEHSRLDTPN